MRLPLILGVIGVVALVGSRVIAAVFGVMRAATVRVRVDGGQA